MGTIRLTTAQALVRFLNQQYIWADGRELPFVVGVFDIFGHGNVLGIGQALVEDPGHLRVVHGKNEQGMAHAAIAYAKQRLRRQIWAVTTSIGPGSANLVTAAATALANNLPVLLLPSDTFASRQPDPVLQQVEHQHGISITTNDALRAVSRYWDRITRPEQIMSSLIRAFELLTNPAHTGPVTICISQDVQGEAYDFDVRFFERRVHYLDRRLPTDRELQSATALVRASKRPLLVIGGGAKYSEAADEIVRLAEVCHIPICETQAGKSTVPASFGYNLGGIGITGTQAANEAAREADLVIGVGTRYTDFTTSSKTAFDFECARFVNINVNRMQAYKLDGAQMVADAKLALRELGKRLHGYRSQWGGRIEELRRRWLAERERLSRVTFRREGFQPEIADQFTQAELNEYADALGTELAQTTALLALNEAVPANAIVIGAAGSLPGDMQRLWHTDAPSGYHMEYGYSCMGYEIAAALGVKLAEPDREVYALVGDGSFLMLHSELVTALQYGVKINVVLFDNSGYGCISNLQMEHGIESFGCEFRDHSGRVMNIDYAKIAEGYGAKGYRVRTLDQLRQAVEDAKEQSISTLIEIKVLPKTMTKGYQSWWNLGVPQVAKDPRVQQAAERHYEQLRTARPY
ncbi:3D-(3,5/4)-trihydroxycyclohexane-1,2-dione acylhydrolase (decyclizing) [Alicyclobacillus sendaiensis]|uniref:3D-(3,5/4)-trihydroxycyclohexane-1,2-dione acylhydrolase (Decyclizing) n=1 Tax=Alicyclobacillus sendaiensis PA2 TaxID=3029425 RepID=A0ABT6Y1J5_ALISE|nr:3D-(3,5/4)-trihydroxycyclohexane-1,2-dione acylhydrolase (decyclizing) [Alicyclobacillus sendaiensis]MDI9261218.1 3D-(3,5/4)-trihydroxycyclohexane-1,2-dione acylhydrolase (decyclizing) [Alicyclobacillus sendaiensis PA2]